MSRDRVMLESVAVTTDSAELLTTAVDGAAGEAEPKVGGEVALGTVGRDWKWIRGSR